MFTAFRVLKRFRFLRGSAFDPFGHTAERRMERQLVVDYVRIVEELLQSLSLGNHALAVEIARVPEHIRGYGHVKDAQLSVAMAKQAQLLAQWRNPMRLQQVA